MSFRIPRSATALVAGAAALTLAGCVVAPAQPYYAQPYYGSAGPVVVAPSAPPPLIVESQVVAPAPGYLWIGGYWTWSGSRHVWSPGHWEAPRPGYRWVPRTWVQGQGGWRQHGGHWDRY